MMRDIIEVASEMKRMFTKEEAKLSIDEVIKDARFTSPEMMRMRWNQLHNAMLDNLPLDHKLWTDSEIAIVSLFSTMPADEIKQRIFA